MLLAGHEVGHFEYAINILTLKADIFSAKFSPNGQAVASAAQDRKICMAQLTLPFDSCTVLWNTYGDCDNYAVLAGHNNAIMEVQWSADGTYVAVPAPPIVLCANWVYYQLVHHVCDHV